MELIQEVGAIVGLAAFFGLAVLALLYFAQAREVRRLQERAAFLPEGERAEAPVAASVAARTGDGEAEAPAAPATAPVDPQKAEQVEAARLAQLAREAAAERRERFERRRRGELGDRALGGQLPSVGDFRSNWIAILGVLLLVAGLIFGATRLLGGEEEAPAPASKGGKQGDVGAPAPGAVSLESATVAVLNGTAEPGLAATVGDEVEDAGVSRLGAVTNTPTPFEVSTVMYEQGGEDAAQQLADTLGIGKTEPVTPEIEEVADAAQLVVVVGEDQATGTGAEDTGSLESEAGGTGDSVTP